MRDLELAADVARAHAQLGHLDDSAARHIGQWAAVDEIAAELVHFAIGLVLVLMLMLVVMVVVVVFKHLGRSVLVGENLARLVSCLSLILISTEAESVDLVVRALAR